MKIFDKRYLITGIISLLSLLSVAQCSFTFTFFGSGNAPSPGNSAILETCSFIGEAVTTNGVVAGDTYCVDVTYTSAVPGGLIPFVVIYDAFYNPIASGLSPVSFTAPSSGTYYTVPFIDQFCGTFDPNFGCNSTLWTNGNGCGPVGDVITECTEYTWAFNNQTYTATGTYTDSVSNGVGGYNYGTLALTIIIDSAELGVSTGPGNILQSQSTLGNYQWIDCNTNLPIGGATNQTFSPTQTGNYAVIISDTSCIDTSACSFVMIPTYEYASICDSYTWTFNNQTYSTPGAYVDSIPVPGGFQVSNLVLTSIINPIDLVVVNNGINLTSQSNIGNYQWIDCGTNLPIPGATGHIFTPSQTGSYAVIISDSNCMDTSVCSFLMLPTEENISFCNDYTWPFNNQTYTSSGVYVDSLPVSGGYQVATLNLTIGIDPSSLVVTDSSGTLYSQPNLASYQWIDCATNLPISGATNQTFTPTQTGNYAVVLTDSICSDTSACTSVQVSGLEFISNLNLSIVPNPTYGQVTVNFEGKDVQVEVMDSKGKLIYSDKVSDGDQIDLRSFEAGVYFFNFQSSGRSEVRRVVRVAAE